MILVPLLLYVLLGLLALLWWHSRERYRHLLAAIEVVTVPDFASAQLQNRRTLYIYLPPAYHQSPRHYKTLYVNDGQERKALKLRQTLATLYARRRMAPVIVVVVPSNEARLQEYGTAVATETRLDAGRRIAHALVRRGPRRAGLRFWFQAATQDEVSDRDDNGVIDAIQDTRELIDELVKLGYTRGQEVVYVEVRSGRHNYETWAQVLPRFLEWAFPP